jgi:hypothetical protein
MPLPRTAKTILKGIGCLAALVIAWQAYLWVPVLWDLWRAGYGQTEAQHGYSATNQDNLRALHTALMRYHESEEKFPPADKWMDAIEPYLYTEDLKKGEEQKKLVHPMFWPPNGRDFGYALNDACAGKYKDDIKDPDNTPLVFDSKDTSRNAHGDPKKLAPAPPREGGNLGITVGGKIVPIGTN